MFETILYGAILLVIGIVMLFGTDAGITAAFLIVLIAVVGIFLAFPEVGIILFTVLILAIILKSIKAKIKAGPEGQEQKSSDAIGCLRVILGFFLALPGGIAVFITMIMNDYDILAALAWIACILVGVRIMGIGSDS